MRLRAAALLLLLPSPALAAAATGADCAPDRATLAALSDDVQDAATVVHKPGYPNLYDRRIRVTDVVQRVRLLTARYGDGVTVREIGAVGGFPLLRIDLPALPGGGRGAGAPPEDSPTGGRSPTEGGPYGPPKHVLITAGVHGNEPTGVATALAFVDHAMHDDSLRRGVAYTVIPMVNPTGLDALTRDDAAGADVNRSFVGDGTTAESRLVLAAIRGDRFDVSIDLHGAWERGFFLIRGADDAGLSARILEVLPARERWGEAGEHVGPYVLTGPGEAMSDNPGTLKGWMTAHGTPLAYTMEYPRRLPPASQLAWMESLVVSAMRETVAAK